MKIESVEEMDRKLAEDVKKRIKKTYKEFRINMCKRTRLKEEIMDPQLKRCFDGLIESLYKNNAGIILYCVEINGKNMCLGRDERYYIKECLPDKK